MSVSLSFGPALSFTLTLNISLSHTYFRSPSPSFAQVLEPGTLQAPGVPGGGAGCLLPALDMLNHHHDAAMLWRNDSNRLAFVTPRALSSGTQVYNNYGAKGNEELLAGYGFCLPDNPHDTLALQLRWPHAVFPPRAAAFLAGAIAGANAAAAHASAQASGVLREESQHAEGSSPITSEESQHAEGSSSTTIALASEPQPRLRFTLRGVGEDLAGTVPQVATLLLPSDTVAGWTRHSEFAATDLLTVSEQLSALAQLRHRFETSAATTAMPLQGEAFVVPEARSRAAALYRASQARVAERLTALATTQALTTVKTLAAADRTYKGPTLGTIASRMASGESTQLRLSTLATQRQVAAVLAAFVGLDADLLLALVLCMREEALGSYGNTVRSLNVSIDTQINNNITDSPLPWPRSTALPVPHVPPIARTRWRQWQQAQETSLSDLLAPEVCAMLLATGCFDPSRLTRAAVERRLWYVHSRGVATPDGELCLISALDDVPRHAVATLEMHTDAESDALVLTCFGRPLADVVDDVTTASLPAVLPLADMAGIPWDTGAMVLAHAAIPWGVCSGGIQTWAVVADEATSRAQVETGTNDACSTTAGGVAADSATVVTPSDCEDSEVAATTGVEPAAAATKVVTRGANADSTAEAGSLQTTEGAEDSEAADSSEDEAFLQIFIGNTRRTLCALQSDIQADCWQHLRQVMEDDTAAADAHAARNPSDALAVNCAALAALAKAEMEIVLRARGVCASGGD